MQTTIDLDDDVSAAAKELAQLENSSAGAVVSRLLRQALTAVDTGSARTLARFRALPRRCHVVTIDHVNAIREKDEV